MGEGDDAPVPGVSAFFRKLPALFEEEPVPPVEAVEGPEKNDHGTGPSGRGKMLLCPLYTPWGGWLEGKVCRLRARQPLFRGR
ncbi:hypothetical protein MASR2M79_14750 [Aminivibrio sp.]